jgi:hypothetical protein
MNLFPYPPMLVALFAFVIVISFIVVGFYAWLDWTSRHDGPPSVRQQIEAENRTEAIVEPVDQPTATAPLGEPVPVFAPAAQDMPASVPTTVPTAAPPAPVQVTRPPLPTRAPAARSRSFDPADHEQALTEALFVAAQADSGPGVTRLVPLRPVSAESTYSPDVDEHVMQALAAGHSYRDGYVGTHRAVMS